MEINKIYNEDCLEGMKRIPDKSVDLVVTSPPYNIEKEYEGKQKDFIIYSDWLKSVFCEVERVLKHGGIMALNLGTYVDKKTGNATPLSFLLFPLLCETGLIFRQNIIWTFRGGMQAKLKLTGQYEDVLVFYKEGDKPFFDLESIRVKEWEKFDKRNNPNGKNPTNVWSFNRVAKGSKEKTNHPCQFPTKMIDRLIKAYSPVNGIVVDPFMGSGTTAIACMNTNRNYIGFELDKEYFDIATSRIKNNTTQLG